jgi:hypothetical protein
MVAANFLGNYEIQGSVIIQAEKGVAAGITKGDIVALTSNKWVTAAVSASAPFGLAVVRSRLTADVDVTVGRGNLIGYTVADGAINPNQPLKISAATAGQVIAATIGTDAYDKIVGIYLAKENEGDGFTMPTAAADADTIRFQLGGIC